jgi:chaperonin GroES
VLTGTRTEHVPRTGFVSISNDGSDASPEAEARGGRAQSMKIRPLYDRVLVKRIDEEVQTKGGIIIPDTAKEKPQEGRVIAVGNGKLLDDGNLRPLEVKAGDKVLFSKYAGTDVVLEGDEHTILREDDVLAILS